MHIKTITYQRTRNYGNESEKIELTVELSNKDDVDKAINHLANKASRALFIIRDDVPPF